MNNLLWTLTEHMANLYQGAVCSAFLMLMLSRGGRKSGRLWAFLVPTVLEYLALTASDRIPSLSRVGVIVYFAILAVTAFIFYEGSPLKKAVISLIPVNAFAVGSITAFNLVSFAYYGPVYEIMTKNSIFRLIAIIAAGLISTLILSIVVLPSGKRDIHLGNGEWAFMGAVLCLTILTANMVYNLAFEVQSRQSKLYTALAVLGLTAMNILDYILMISLAKKHRLEMDNSRLTQQLTLQEAGYKEIKQQYEQLHRIRHDVKNTLEVIKAMSNKEGTARITEYINSYQATWDELVHIINTDNDYVNAIVNSKLAIAKSHGIQTGTFIAREIGGKRSLELCSVIGNMFDNAIEACLECEGSKQIMLEVYRKDNRLELLMKNTVREAVLKDNPALVTTKKDKSVHGYGTRIIREVAERCDGYADFYERDGQFFCHVVIDA